MKMKLMVFYAITLLAIACNGQNQCGYTTEWGDSVLNVLENTRNQYSILNTTFETLTIQSNQQIDYINTLAIENNQLIDAIDEISLYNVKLQNDFDSLLNIPVKDTLVLMNFDTVFYQIDSDSALLKVRKLGSDFDITYSNYIDRIRLKKTDINLYLDVYRDTTKTQSPKYILK